MINCVFTGGWRVYSIESGVVAVEDGGRVGVGECGIGDGVEDLLQGQDESQVQDILGALHL